MKPSHVLRVRSCTTPRNEGRRTQRTVLLQIRIVYSIVTLLLTLSAGPARAGSVVQPEFPGAPWESTSTLIPPGVLAHRMECLLTSPSSDTLRLAVSSDSPPVVLPDRLRTEIQAGRARLSLRVTGGEGPHITQPLSGAPVLVSGKPEQMKLPLTSEELRRFLYREIQLDVSIQQDGRPLPGLTGSARLTETSPGRYQLSLSFLQLMQLRNPDTCNMLLFSPDVAYRVWIPTGIRADSGRPTESVIAVATLATEAGLAPQVLLLSPLSVDLGTVALNQPGECSFSLTSWGSTPKIIPLTFSSGDFQVENLPRTIRLEPGQTTPLVFNVAAKRSGKLSGKVNLGTSGGSVEVTGTAQGDGGSSSAEGNREKNQIDVTLSAEAVDSETFRIRWKSPGEGFSYTLVCRSVSSPEAQPIKFDFKGQESRAVGQPEFADFRGLPADGTYTFELTVLRNGQVVQSKVLANKRLIF